MGDEQHNIPDDEFKDIATIFLNETYTKAVEFEVSLYLQIITPELQNKLHEHNKEWMTLVQQNLNPALCYVTYELQDAYLEKEEYKNKKLTDFDIAVLTSKQQSQLEQTIEHAYQNTQVLRDRLEAYRSRVLDKLLKPEDEPLTQRKIDYLEAIKEVTDTKIEYIYLQGNLFPQITYEGEQIYTDNKEGEEPLTAAEKKQHEQVFDLFYSPEFIRNIEHIAIEIYDKNNINILDAYFTQNS